MQAPLPNSLPPYPIASTGGGVHSGLPPYLLAPNQLAFAINVTNRGGYASTRPAWLKRTLNYVDEDVLVNLRSNFQGAAFYRAIGNNPSCMLASVGGRLFRFRVQNITVTVDDITPDRNDPNQPQVWMAQGQDFMVINDGQSNPWFYDGASARRSGGYAQQELPPGRMVHYVNGRFVMVLPDGISYIASDLVYNTGSGTPQYNYRDAILKIKDNEAILNGQAFAVPVNSGAISALFSVAIPDTSLGQGPLQVSTPQGIYSVNLPLDATLWTTTQQPTQVVALPNGGPTGQYAVTTVNGDAWYRAKDGLRSFVVARRDFNTWVQTPLSFEMQRILPFDDQALLPFASVVDFNNRFLATCSPYKTDGRGIAFRGLTALDFNNISSITTRAQPSYDGLWTGLPILQIVKSTFDGVDRLFAFALDAINDICIYELAYDDAAYFDFDGVSDVGIESSIESGSMWGREADPVNISQSLKRIEAGDLFLEQLLGPNSATPPGKVEFTVKYRSDQYPFWTDWKSFNLCAQSCSVPERCTQPRPVQTQYATFKRLPVPSSECNSLTGRPFREAYTYQVQIACKGHFTLHRFNFWCIQAPSTRNVVCEDGDCQVITGCSDNPFSYRIETGPGTSGLIEWDVNRDKPTWDVPAGSTIGVS